VLDFGLAKVKPPATPLGDDAPTLAMFATRKGTIAGAALADTRIHTAAR